MTDATMRELERAAAADLSPDALTALSAARVRAGLCPEVTAKGTPIPMQGPRERPPDLMARASVLMRARRPHRTTIHVARDGLLVRESFIPTIVSPAHVSGSRPASCPACERHVQVETARAHKAGRARGWRGMARVRVDLVLAGVAADAAIAVKRKRLREERGLHWGSGTHATAKRAWQEACRDALGLGPPARAESPVAPEDLPLFLRAGDA